MRARTLTLLICAVALTTASTAQVPTLIKDINPTGNSNVALLTYFESEVFFMATDGVYTARVQDHEGRTLHHQLVVIEH
jgi:hypothetical protein